MKVYIVEDEANILKDLIHLIQKIPFVQLVGYSDSVQKAKTEIPQLEPDLLLADIKLKDNDVFALLSAINTDKLQIIFVTAYDEYAIKALNIGAFAYLLKPIDEKELTETLEKCFKKSEEFKFNQYQLEIAASAYTQHTAPKKIVLKSMDFLQVVKVEDIIYCNSDTGYTTFYLKDGTKIMVSKVLKEYEEILPKDKFFRCHQSYLIHLEYINKYYKEGYLVMTNGEKIPVSSRKREQFSQLLKSSIF